MLGLLFVVASVNFGVFLLFRDLVLAGVFGMDTSGWTSRVIGDSGWWVQSIVITLITISQALFNHFGIKATTALTDFSGYLIFVVADRPDADCMLWRRRTGTSRGCSPSSTTPARPAATSCRRPRGAFVAFLIGLLYPIYTITGFDASAHTSEETHKARRTVPRGMIHSVFWSLALRLLHGGVLHPGDAGHRPRRPRTGRTPGSTCSPTCRCRRLLKRPAGDRHRGRELHLRAWPA